MFGTSGALMVRLLQIIKLSMDDTSTLKMEAKLKVWWWNADGTYSKYDAATIERLTNEFFTTGDNRLLLYWF